MDQIEQAQYRAACLRVEQLERAIRNHRRELERAGSVKGASLGDRLRMFDKHKIDQALWRHV